jgi:hypothetical protein
MADAVEGAEAAAGEGMHPPLRLFFLCVAEGDGALHARAAAVAGALRARGHEVVGGVVGGEGASAAGVAARFEAAGCEVVGVPDPGERRVGSFLALRRRIRAGRFDAAHGIGARATGLLLSATTALRGAPPVLCTLESEPLPGRSALKRLRGARVARVVVESEVVRRAVGRAVWGVTRKSEVVPPFVEAVVCTAGGERGGVGGVPAHGVAGAGDDAAVRGGGVREALGIPASDPVAGLLVEGEAAEAAAAFVAVAAMVLHQVPEARFACAAPVDPGELAARARERGVESRVVWVEGGTAGLLAVVDVAVVTAGSETLPLHWLEAPLREVPIVAYDGGGSRGVVRHGATGFLARPGDVRALAARVVELLRQPERRRAMGRAGRADVESRFSLEAAATAYERIFNEMRGCTSTAGS